MREIILDTETTGLSPNNGDRIVEIGAVELLNRAPTGATFHVYLNPERDVPAEAARIHGLTSEFLRDKPLFPEIVDDFLKFIATDQLVIHNAEFDMRFLNAELSRIARPILAADRAYDTLALARKRFPGAKHSLDALCARFGIDASRRKKHGALLDCELLADVYVELKGGRQNSLGLQAPTAISRGVDVSQIELLAHRIGALNSRLTDADLRAHADFVNDLSKPTAWLERPGQREAVASVEALKTKL